MILFFWHRAEKLAQRRSEMAEMEYNDEGVEHFEVSFADGPDADDTDDEDSLDDEPHPVQQGNSSKEQIQYETNFNHETNFICRQCSEC